ncbi:GDSL-type esterase/lipase family protein [Chitinophaga filiformis]|uniref:SGNH/GDSL hydrolase family protein n=1 Tax=Chitinophaga filiformis TaxID=104663 RepID=UPI001F3EABE1|nr:GDSL-type esterase/lipase family protein [Chitinophaga filiformis]MCF6404492.1 GDSL-type esterase/lipase family protein [Chitinophaga filiformis]
MIGVICEYGGFYLIFIFESENAIRPCQMPLSRRTFLKRTFFVFGLLSACRKQKEVDNYDTSESILNITLDRKFNLSATDKLLFIGDSITDFNRDRNITAPNEEAGLGKGFVRQISTELLGSGKFANLEIYNRGYSGYVTEELLLKFEADVLTINANVISILIGVNDLRNNHAPLHYYGFYKQLISKIRQQLPAAEIIICEPFTLPNAENYETMQANLHEYRKVVRTLARDYKTTFIPYNEYFLAESKTTPVEDLLYDGIHPASKGFELLKEKWLSWMNN